MAQKRRKPGTGAIRHKPGRDQPWEAAFPIGKDRYRYDYFATRSEAERHLDTLTAERDDRQQPRDVASGSQKVETFLTAWVNMKKPFLRPSSVALYSYLAEYAIAYLGQRRLDSVRREDVEAMLVDLADKGIRSVGHLRTVMKQAFQHAVDEDYIKKNPFARSRLPRVEHVRTAVLTAPERDAMLAYAAEHNDELLPIWHIYSRCGLRRGEALGLKWSDIDLKAATLTIRRQYVSVRGEAMIGDPKTQRSARTIPLPADIVALLETHRQQQARRAATADRFTLQGYVFADAKGDPITPLTIVYRWRQLRRASGTRKDVTIHGLRHTAQFLLEQAGAPRSVLMALLGHTSVKTSERYSDHASIEDIRRAIGD